MTGTRKIIVAILIVGVLILGVGYAAMNSITLKITGALGATTNDENFKVKFTNASPSEGNVIATLTGDTTATLDVSGLTAKGEKVTATYTIQNISEDLSANLSAAATNENKEYFSVSTSLSETSIAKGGTSTLTVTVELLKTPVEGNETDTVGINVVAEPIQPQ